MDIDAELDAAPLAWAGATVVTHEDSAAARGDAATTSVISDEIDPLDDPFAEAVSPPKPRHAERTQPQAQQAQRQEQQQQPSQQPPQAGRHADNTSAGATRSSSTLHSGSAAQGGSGPLPPAPPPAGIPAQSQQQPQAAATAARQPKAGTGATSTRQQQQQPPRPRQQQAPSIIDSAGPRRPLNLEPLRDPFAPSLQVSFCDVPQPPAFCPQW